MTASNKYEKLCKTSQNLGESNDCAVKALAITCRTSYQKAHAALAEQGRKSGKGVYYSQLLNAIDALGYKFVRRDIPKGSTVNNYCHTLPNGHFMVQINGHVLAVHNGVAMDWTKGRKHRIKSCARIVKK